MNKPILVIGSTCVDIIINIHHLPVTEENIRPTSQSMALGGCAFNVANILRQSGTPFTFISPVGSGVYGDYVAEHLEARGFAAPLRVPEENGCCYCLVEEGGERTFMSYHGVEYTFQKQWMEDYNARDYSMIYVCGLEVEESTGDALVSWLEENPGPVIFFAPGPRVGKIPAERLERLLNLHPVLHVNHSESQAMSGCGETGEAARFLAARTKAPVIVTLGEKGALCQTPEGELWQAPGVPVKPVDTIGAGDSHIGALMACLYRGMDMEKALRTANQVSSAVVGVKGASLEDEAFMRLIPAEQERD